jgi:hypothetical protein
MPPPAVEGVVAALARLGAHADEIAAGASTTGGVN